MLFRLSKSQYANDFVLKGAILFQIWSGDSHRPTRDVDLFGYGDPSIDRFTKIFRSLAELDVADDGIRFDADSIAVQTMNEDEEYLNQHFRFCRSVKLRSCSCLECRGEQKALTTAPRSVSRRESARANSLLRCVGPDKQQPRMDSNKRE